ncbi:MAG: DNA mismatch repair endonuclease MutH [Buchnera aphidicola (Chaetogeoica yunlongensis)]
MCIFCEQDLLMRAKAIYRYTIKEIFIALDMTVSKNLVYNKGFIGKLLEYILGVSSKVRNKKCIDFPNLEIELKSIPVSKFNIPLESTFICNAPLMDNGIEYTWKNSYIYNKVKKILWIPIYGSLKTSFFNKVIGKAFIWTMKKSQLSVLEEDWNFFMDLISVGKINKISSRDGQFLQVKKKCKNNFYVSKYIDHRGQLKKINPRAFYLKKTFTQKILKNF